MRVEGEESTAPNILLPILWADRSACSFVFQFYFSTCAVLTFFKSHNIGNNRTLAAILKHSTMTFYDRYISGETVKVYEDIYKLGNDAFLPNNLVDIKRVLTETFERVAYNLDIIFQELLLTNYQFKTKFEYNCERPLHRPLPNTETLLKQLDNSVKSFGYVPLSLKYFYKLVGGVNFIWDYETNENFRWEMADPIHVVSLNDLIDFVIDDDWAESIQEFMNDYEIENAYLELSPDDLHKDNVSGGASYAVEITNYPSIDSKFLNEPNDTTFINYLRICFDYCGFPSITRSDTQNDYQTFFDKVKPKLKQI